MTATSPVTFSCWASTALAPGLGWEAFAQQDLGWGMFRRGRGLSRPPGFTQQQRVRHIAADTHPQPCLWHGNHSLEVVAGLAGAYTN